MKERVKRREKREKTNSNHSKENDENVPTLNDTLMSETLQELSDEVREGMAEEEARDEVRKIEEVRNEVSGISVKECSVCHEVKELSKFFKDINSTFRNYKGEPDDTKLSEDCRACRLRRRREEHKEWLKVKGIK